MTRCRRPCVERLFWQSGGGFDRNIWEPRTLRAVIDSIHWNPVHRGLVERMMDWRWSSAGWFEGGEQNGLAPARAVFFVMLGPLLRKPGPPIPATWLKTPWPRALR